MILTADPKLSKEHFSEFKSVIEVLYKPISVKEFKQGIAPL